MATSGKARTFISKVRKLAGKLPKISEPSWENFLEFFRLGDGILEMNPAEIRKRYDDLVALVMAKGGKLEVTRDAIEVTLGPIMRRTSHGDRYSIGKYRFVIFQTGGYQFWHLSDTTRQHPTVGSGGTACLGNAGYGMADFLERKRFDFAVELAEEFLRVG